jgi:hypothetical protein
MKKLVRAAGIAATLAGGVWVADQYRPDFTVQPGHCVTRKRDLGRTLVDLGKLDERACIRAVEAFHGRDAGQ